jgi:RND family efflux transporter MFP subunit
MTVEPKTRQAWEDVIGTVRPRLRSVIEAKVSGRIDQMRVVPGQGVKAGELLAQLNVRESQAKLDQALATREQAERDLKRFSELLTNKVITPAEFESAQTRQRLAEAAVVEAQSMLDYSKITAPFAGVITRKLADVGDLAAPGKPLLEMEDSSALRLEAEVPEALGGKLQLGMNLPVHISALTNELTGSISEMSPAIDPNSRTFLVKLDLPSDPALRTGQFGHAAVPVAEIKVLRVPEAAVLQRGQMELVFVVVSNKAQLRLVKTGKRIGNEVELVSGISQGEQIVAEGAAGLVDGQSLQVKP